jgi:hypothetical protein
VPIIVTVSDAEWHDGLGQAALYADDPSYPTSYCSPCTGVPTRATTIAAIKSLGAHVIGLGGTNGNAMASTVAMMTQTAYDTGATVTPNDFGSGAARPTGCNPGQCCTGLVSTNINVPPDANGLCPLAFTYDDSTGNGVGNAVSTGIVALANGLKFDIHVQASDVDPMTVERFMLKVVPNVSGVGPASMCIVVPTANLQDNFTGPLATTGGDGVPDTVPGVVNGQLVCFDVIPKMNTSVPDTTKPQFFHAQLQVKGATAGGMINLGTPRDVFFLVPPKIVNGPIQ